MLTRLQAISTTARRTLDALLEPSIRAPIVRAWDPVLGAPNVRVTLLDDWPVRPLRLVLAWRPCEARFALALELGGHDPRVLSRPSAAWTSPSAHDPSIGWTLRATEHGTRLMDVDGLGMWLLPPDARGTPRARLSSSFGQVIDLRLGADGELLGIDSVRGRVDVEEGAVVRTSAAGAEPLARFVCDDAGRVRRIERSRRAPVEVDYDARGGLASVQRTDGASLTFETAGDHDGRVTWARVTSSTLGRWEIAHPAQDVTLAVDAARAETWHLRVDEVGWPIEQRGPDGVLTTMERDPESGAIVRLARGSYHREFFYDADGAIVFSSGSLGVSTELRYDEAGRVTQITRGERTLLRRAFDLAGHKVATLLDGQWVELDWSEAGACEMVRDARGPRALEWSGPDLVRCSRGETRWSARHDADGRPFELSGPDGESITLAWTRRGRLDGWRCADGLARRYGWHPTGAWTGVQDEGEAHAFERDDEGRLTAVPHHDVRVQWSPAGYAASLRGHGLDEVRVGGPDARRALVTREGRAVEALERDALARVVARHAGGRPDVALTWSPVGPIASCRWSERLPKPVRGIARLEPPETAQVELRFEHDGAGGLRVARDPLGETVFERQDGRVTSETRGASGVRSGRDEAGFRMVLRSSPGLEVQLRRDGEARVVQLSARMEGETLDVSFGYDRDGREARRSFAGGLELVFERDALGRLISRRVLRGGRVLDETSYGWRGARLHEERSRTPVRYAYDGHGTLTWAVPAEGEPLPYGSPADGAYRGPVVSGCRYAQGGLPLATADAALRHDAAGRREARSAHGATTRYAYDALNRLVRIEEPTRRIEHAYDALGRRIGTRVTAAAPTGSLETTDGESLTPPRARQGRIEHVWDGLELLHRLGDYAEPVTYVRADGLLVALRARDAWWVVLPDPGGEPDVLLSASGEPRWARRPATRVLGAVDIALDETGLSLGVPAWAGHVWDPASGLWSSLAGDYDPATGRYLVPGPFGICGGPWLYAGPPDPVRPTVNRLPRAPLAPFDELGAHGLDALWLRNALESLACDRDEGAARAWVEMHDDRPPTPLGWMTGGWC